MCIAIISIGPEYMKQTNCTHKFQSEKRPPDTWQKLNAYLY